jgi:hypothetical protein
MSKAGQQLGFALELADEFFAKSLTSSADGYATFFERNRAFEPSVCRSINRSHSAFGDQVFYAIASLQNIARCEHYQLLLEQKQYEKKHNREPTYSERQRAECYQLTIRYSRHSGPSHFFDCLISAPLLGMMAMFYGSSKATSSVYAR